MDLSYDLSSIISTTSFFFLALYYAKDLRLFAATAAGILLAVGFNKYTAAFTERETTSVNRLVRSSKTGPATIILAGIAIGYESTVWAVMIIVLSIILSIAIYSVAIPAAMVPFIIGISVVLALAVGIILAIRTKKIEDGIFSALGVIVIGLIVRSFEPAPVGQEFIFIMYSVALAGIGMLSHTGNNLAMDAFGPLADNAGGIAEMAKEDFEDPESQRTLATLDSVGNTTKAITKGIAIASAVIAALSLFASYIEVTGLEVEGLNIADPLVFVGLLIGGALPFLFSSVLLRAVERAAALIIEEVRKQFRVPGVMEGTTLPDYGKVVTICTNAAQRELIVVAMLGILVPIIVGFLIGERALGGFLAGIIVTGQLLAVFMANSGGAWDNAKKQIEDEPSDPENNLGKFSERHKAGVIGDTVGDPLKDTAGPALNPMIKVVNLVSLLIAPLIISVAATGGSTRTIAYIISGASLVALMVGIVFSMREAKEVME
jgi:K(+)-stimulated pyrophosphate-energized sodium pump